MNSIFYPKLAAANMRKNKNIYLPYLMAGTLMVFLYYVLWSMKVMLEAGAYARASTVLGTISILIGSASMVGILVIVIVMFYINSFVMKRRKKELGLYCVLGMEKKHLLRLVFWEVLYAAAIDLLIGMAAGTLLSQGVFLLLLKLSQLPATLEFTLPLGAVGKTLAVFGVTFGLILLYDFLTVFRTNPIELLHSEASGEREPKTKWLFAFVGFAALGSGYYIALTVRDLLNLINLFVPAVLLVILGTYGLFMAGSILILKLLRRRKRFYYKPGNFISVSGMLYRMKQNAAGLASICVLATMILVTLSCCVSLYLGEEDIIRTKYPRELIAKGAAAQESDMELLEKRARRTAEENGFTVSNPLNNVYFSTHADREENRIILRAYQFEEEAGYPQLMTVMPLTTYENLTGESADLEKGQILFYDSKAGVQAGDYVEISGESCLVAGKPKKVQELEQKGNHYSVAGNLFLVVPDWAEFHRLNAACVEEDGQLPAIEFVFGVDVQGEDGVDENDYYAKLTEAFYSSGVNVSVVQQREAERGDFYQLYGSLLFVGIFFVGLFLAATILIIYYKQITEGFDDRERFRIMQKVGMSTREVKSTIKKQVLQVFFLPLLMAAVHILVAYPVFSRLLRDSFGMYNMTLFRLCTAGSLLAFGCVYLIVYRLTAGTYYRIVES